MTNALVLDMPTEFGLELMAIICSNFTDAERELGDDVVDEGDGAGLIVTFADFEGSDPRGVINGGTLVMLDRLVIFVFESQ